MGMGIYKLDLRACSSIKDKRRIVKSIVDRFGNGKATAIREVGDPDYWKISKLAVLCIADSEKSARHYLDRARDVIEATGFDVIEAGQYVFSANDVVESIVCQGE
jgi:uncharacterized protein YlxP (DUF503 family)